MTTTPSPCHQEISLSQEYQRFIGVVAPQCFNMAGWSFSTHHVYDPNYKALYLGSGKQRSAKDIGLVISTVAGNGEKGYSGDGGAATSATVYPRGIDVGPDGSIYIADEENNRIRRVDPNGIITTVAGNGTAGFSGDNGPATSCMLNQPYGVAVAEDGIIYIADTWNSRIRRVDWEGIITTVAGNGSQGYNGDGIPAVLAGMCTYNVAVGRDGSFYIADDAGHRIRKVDSDGIITTVAGNGIEGYSGDGGPATVARLDRPSDISVAPDGSFLIAVNCRIRKVDIDGIITTVAGRGRVGYEGDGGPATEALFATYGVAAGSDGSFYISDVNSDCIRGVRPDGIINTLAGIGWHSGYNGDGILVSTAKLYNPCEIAIGPDGSMYIADSSNYRVRRVGAALPGVSITDFLIPAEDGIEIYHFNEKGRHLHTLDAITGATILKFYYDNEGRLIQIQDYEGAIVTIERDASGNPVAIIAAGGQRTALILDDNAYLSGIIDPAGDVYRFIYTDSGLLAAMTDPNGNESNYIYDNKGLLVRSEDPAGGSTSLTRVELEQGFLVNTISALGVVTTYQVESLPTGGVFMENTFPDGGKASTKLGTDGSQNTVLPDGTVITMIEGPDPRFGMQAPIQKSIIIATPGGRSYTVQASRQVLMDPSNLLSLESQTDLVNVGGRTYTITYESNTQRLTITTPEGREFICDTDELGRIVGFHMAGIDPITITYDGRRMAQVVQDVAIWSLVYDDAELLSAVTDPLSRSTGLSYDDAGRLIRKTLADDREVLYSYDPNSNLSSIQPPGRLQHMFQYTPVDLLGSYTPPLIGSEQYITRYSYNIDRQITEVLLADGTSVNIDYDTAGRLRVVTLPRGNIICAYDQNTGNLSGITAPDGGILSYEYDGFLQTKEIYSGTISGNVEFSYDSDFQIISRKVNGGQETLFEYDLDGLITRAGNLEISRNTLNGLMVGSKLADVMTSQSYDGFALLKDFEASYNTDLLFARTYTRDNSGSITGFVESTGGVNTTYEFTYDIVGRLSEVKENGILVSGYQYDENSNRIQTTNQWGTFVGTCDEQDRLLTFGGITFSYTDEGALQTKNVGGNITVYNYDAFGNLINATLPDGRQIEYIIDGRNRRIGKKVDGDQVQSFLYEDQLKPVAELDGNNQLISLFIYATRSNVPDYLIKNGCMYRLVYDQLGSVRMAVDAATGEVIQQIEYDEFGNIILDTNPGFQPFGFAGGIFDEHTGFTRLGARDYDPFIGRWTTKDPFRFEGGDLNLYGYVLNDPINFIDPTGTDIPIKTKTRPGYDAWAIAEDQAMRHRRVIKYGGELTFMGGSIVYGYPVGATGWMQSGVTNVSNIKGSLKGNILASYWSLLDFFRIAREAISSSQDEKTGQCPPQR